MRSSFQSSVFSWTGGRIRLPQLKTEDRKLKTKKKSRKTHVLRDGLAENHRCTSYVRERRGWFA